MEKPAQYDYALRIAARASQDRMDYARKYAILHDKPVKEDESQEDAPVWRGDHSFSADAAAYSLSNFIEPEVKKKHPDWSQDMIHEEAVKRFEKRLEQDLSYEKRETRHEETTVHWEIVETAPGVKELATSYGGDTITLRELWDHTREFAQATKSPGSYNAEEAKAQLAMQDAFIQGDASGFVSVLSHPDAIRYVQVWEKSDDGDIVSKQIDLFSTTGRDFSSDESVELIQRVADFQGSAQPRIHTEETSTYAHFFVTEGKQVEESAIKTIAIAQTLVREELRTDDRIATELSEHRSIVRAVSVDTLQATKDMVVLFQSYLSKKIEQSHEHEPAEKRITRKTVSHGATETPVLSKDAVPKQAKKSNAADVIDHVITASVVDRAQFLPIASVAFLSLASRASQEQPAAEQKNILLPKKRESPAPKDSADTHTNESVLRTEIMHLWQHIVMSFSLGRTEVKGRENLTEKRRTKDAAKPDTAGEQKDKAPSLETLIRMLDAFSQFFSTDMPKGELVGPKRREVRMKRLSVGRFYGVESNIKRRLDTFTTMQKRFESVDVQKEQKTVDDDVEEATQFFEEAIVGKMMFSYILWMVVQPPHHKKQSEIPVMNVPAKEKKAQEKQDTETPWILLSIIWQLAMIRESGMVSSPQQSAAVPPTTQADPADPGSLLALVAFPTHGIIFSAALHDRMNHRATSGVFDRLYSYG